jgi:hypothetical protein
MPNERSSPPLAEKEVVIPARRIDLDQIVGGPSRLSAARVTRVAKSEIYSGQTVNRAAKRARLPISRTTSQAPGKHQINLPAPSMMREIVVEPVTT